MFPVGPLPRLLLGSGTLASAKQELSALGVSRPLLVSDQGLQRAGIVAAASRVLPSSAVSFLDVPENPTIADADAAYAAYREGSCDGVVALGGGSVIDTAKFVVALASTGIMRAADLLGQPEVIGANVPPLVAIPTTVGSGSESSPVAALHTASDGPAIGTRNPQLVPRLAICDPDLARTLSPRMIAATGIDALSHCVEGFFAEPVNPMIDALALDGISRVFASLAAATKPEGDLARLSLMAAAFAGGAAIHKGLGPAHAIALACGDQDLHHGTIVGIALPLTVAMVARHAPVKASRVAVALGLGPRGDVAEAIETLNRALGLPRTLGEIGYDVGDLEELVDRIVASPFNFPSPYRPTRDEYYAIVSNLLV